MADTMKLHEGSLAALLVTTAGPGEVLAQPQGQYGRGARGEQVLHPHHPGLGLHRVPLQLQRLQQPGQQRPGGSS